MTVSFLIFLVAILFYAYINNFFLTLAMVTGTSVTMQQIQMMNVSHSYYVLLYVMSHVAKVCRLVYGTSETICLWRR